MHESSKEPSLMCATVKRPAREFTTALRRATPSYKYPCLLPRFEFCRDQADLVDARAAHDIDGARNVHEHYIVIAFDESNFLGTLFKNLFHASAEIFPSDVFIVDLELGLVGLGVGNHLNDNGLVAEILFLLLIRIGLGYQRVHALRRQRRDDHEDDQQHEQNIDERNDVHFRHRTAGIFSYGHSHGNSPVLTKTLQLYRATLSRNSIGQLPAWR